MSKVMAQLAEAELPAGLAEREPDLDGEDYRAAMRVVAALLGALEREQDADEALSDRGA
ncbi:hypothetical protein G6O69_34730 [Pseudenhygromyxa sp. WMMC2535]|uniref:hypothetical protein n=1 Tax=Pseudenhygromyxa sp. WMMC2535 TaxID=2712867 RepID=UPI0015950524|nr:hypothetical protein [Pseudenhygromyxa sp. WMMC2535]NVB43030.1 hypothetical protein [Pseudenhygromyxa sp. WMMC2535]